MSKPYSIDLREMIIQEKLSGSYTDQEIADKFMIGLTSVKKYIRKYNQGESLIPLKPTGRPSTISEQDRELIRKYIILHPDATLEEYCVKFKKETNRIISRSNMHLIIREINLCLNGCCGKKEIFIKTIKKSRLKKGYTQKELAKKTGINKTSICLFESGVRTPSFRSVRRIAFALLGIDDFHQIMKEFGVV